jgi:AraC family transcriptional regulator, exoenzyme S synthesis regulatory protein ExsA
MIINHKHIHLQDKVVIEKITFHPPLRRSGSMHEEACLIFNITGTNTIYGANQKEIIKSNEAVLLKCGEYVETYQKSADNEPSEIIVIHFHQQTLRKIYNNDLPHFFGNEIAKAQGFMHRIQLENILLNYVNTLMFYFANPSVVNDELVSLKIKEIILLLIKTTENVEQIQRIFQNLFNPTEVAFKDIVEANIYEDLALPELACLTNNSLANFKKKFKNIYHQSPALYIKNKKLAKAEALIKNTSIRISDVCFSCGFNNFSHFTKAFTKQFGSSPSKYRESTKNAIL